MMDDYRTFSQALAQAFLNLGQNWVEDGGSLPRWSQRAGVVAGGMFHSDLIADAAYRRLIDQRDGIIARIAIDPSAITTWRA